MSAIASLPFTSKRQALSAALTTGTGYAQRSSAIIAAVPGFISWPMASAVAQMAAASPATCWSFISEVFIAVTCLAFRQNHLGGLLRCGKVRLGPFHLAGGCAVDALPGHPLGVIALGIGQQLVEAVALAQDGGIAGFQEVGCHVVSDVGAQSVDEQSHLLASLGVPHRPGVVAFAVGHGVVRPDLEGFAGLVFGAWHVGRDLNSWLLRNELHDLPRHDLGGSLGRNWFNDRFHDWFKRVTDSGCNCCTTPWCRRFTRGCSCCTTLVNLLHYPWCRRYTTIEGQEVDVR